MGDGSRLRALDGLRGFAALGVVFAHAVVYLGLLPFAPLGGMGVLVFFCLSGYLVAGMCWRTAPTISAWAFFVRRRARRLLPALAGMVLLGGALLVAIGHIAPREVAREGGIALLQGTAFSWASGDGSVVAFMPTWSLTVEWAFYLSFPLVLLALRRRALGTEAVARSLAGIAIVFFIGGVFMTDRQFYLLPVGNLAVLFAGAALATWHLERPEPGDIDSAWASMAVLMLAILVVLPGYPLSWAWKAAVVPAVTVSTLAILHATWGGNAVSRALASPVLAATGLRSYSLYLWHLPVMWLVWVNLPGVNRWAVAAIALLLTAFVTHLSFLLFERPVMGLKDLRKASGVTPAGVITARPRTARGALDRAARASLRRAS